ncbi:MAG: hypothetical protein H0X30_08545 [Anaerolineae bacterium]|nr:hypothetical protein [Anaerolineae bacterium]
MKHLNVMLTLVVVVLFVSLMRFAGQPITPEADLVQQWYDELCRPTADQSLLHELTWRGDESDTQLQAIFDAYRSANDFSNGCTAVENHNIIYFQSIPPELASTIERIKFVAVNVYQPDKENIPNHVISVQFGVHVLFYKTGVVKILPQFMPDSPLGLHQGLAPVTLYNNDGLLMGQVQLNGALIQIPQNDLVRYGIPIQLSTARAWGRCWVRIYADGIEVATERFADILPTDQQAAFLPASIENFPANDLTQGVVWFSLPNTIHPTDVRISVDAYQTLWDLRALPATLKVQ